MIELKIGGVYRTRDGRDYKVSDFDDEDGLYYAEHKGEGWWYTVSGEIKGLPDHSDTLISDQNDQPKAVQPDELTIRDTYALTIMKEFLRCKELRVDLALAENPDKSLADRIFGFTDALMKARKGSDQ